MKSIDAGPAGTKLPGQTYAVPRHEAHALVNGGYAEFADKVPAEAPQDAPEETATVDPSETTTIPAKRGRKS